MRPVIDEVTHDLQWGYGSGRGNIKDGLPLGFDTFKHSILELGFLRSLANHDGGFHTNIIVPQALFETFAVNANREQMVLIAIKQKIKFEVPLVVERRKQGCQQFMVNVLNPKEEIPS